MALFDLLLLTFAGLYALALIVLTLALLAYRPRRVSGEIPFVSVLIPARDESARIALCLEALVAQGYDPECFEVIVIDDRSEDGTSEQAEAFRDRLRHLTVVRIRESSPDMAPKKHALTQGIRQSKGEIILCTDADCRPERDWIRTMVAHFSDEVGMVIGYSPIEPVSPRSLFHHFVALDSLALASVAASTAAFGKPLTATGRSLAYRKRTFDEVGGFSAIAQFVSGDDDLLLQMVRGTRWKIAYSMSGDSLVLTDPPSSFRQFIHQKIRQASKGRHYTCGIVLLLVMIYLFNISLITYVPIKAFFFGSWTTTWAWIAKVCAELLILSAGASRFRRWRYLTLFPVIALLHPLYVVVFGLWGQLGKFEWKSVKHEKILRKQGGLPS